MWDGIKNLYLRLECGKNQYTPLVVKLPNLVFDKYRLNFMQTKPAIMPTKSEPNTHKPAIQHKKIAISDTLKFDIFNGSFKGLGIIGTL